MFETIVIITVILFLILSLYREWFQPAISFLIAVLILSLTGIISSDEILKGFANKEIASILLLIVFGNLLGNASILNVFFMRAFHQTKTYTGFMTKLLPSVTGLSAFMNNTPIVALLIPYVYKWSKRNRVPISKLLIPVSFAAILGGTITLVGTSTNMVVNAFANAETDIDFKIFDFAWVGLPLSVIGLIYLILFGKKLLPNRETLSEQFKKFTREYVVEAEIPEGSDYIGKSIKEANLRELDGLFVVEIIRDNQQKKPVTPNDILEQNDILILAGNVDAITALIDNNSNLKLPKYSLLEDRRTFNISEVVVAQGSYLANKVLKKSDFRRRYDAALLAINRRGKQLKGKLGNKTIRTGDTLLLVTGEDFDSNEANIKDFYKISDIKQITSLNVKQSIVIFVGLIAAILFSTLGILPLFNGLLLLLLIAILTRTLTFSKLNQYIDYNLLIIAAFALSLGAGIENTGLAAVIAEYVVLVTQSFGPLGALIGLYLLTFIFTELMTNIAAASLALPFGLAIANKLGVSPEPFFLAIAYAASASFLTPVGYQTNLMVYGPGGYQFKDFLKFGLPLAIAYFILAIFILNWLYF